MQGVREESEARPPCISGQASIARLCASLQDQEQQSRLSISEPFPARKQVSRRMHSPVLSYDAVLSSTERHPDNKLIVVPELWREPL